MEGNEKTKLTISQNGTTMTWEGPWDASLDDIMEGLIGCLRGLTFGEWCIKSIRDWCNEYVEEEDEEPEEEEEEYVVPETGHIEVFPGGATDVSVGDIKKRHDITYVRGEHSL